MAAEIPIVRQWIACQQIVVDSESHDYSLHHLIYAVVPLPREEFPYQRELALFALLTSGRGEHDFAIELTFLERGEEGKEAVEDLVQRSSVRRLDLGQDPLRVIGLPFRGRVRFATPGQYTFYLICDDQRIGEVHLDVR